MADQHPFWGVGGPPPPTFVPEQPDDDDESISSCIIDGFQQVCGFFMNHIFPTMLENRQEVEEATVDEPWRVADHDMVPVEIGPVFPTVFSSDQISEESEDDDDDDDDATEISEEMVMEPTSIHPVAEIESPPNAFSLMTTASSSVRSQNKVPRYLLKMLAILGAIIDGYAFNVTGAAFGIGLFLYRFSRKIYHDTAKGISTNFCSYADLRILFLSSAIQFCCCLSMWVAFKLSTKIGRRLVLLIGVMIMICGISLVSFFSHADVIGIILIGLGVGFTHQIIPLICSELSPPRDGATLGIIAGYQVLGSALLYAGIFLGSFYIRWGWRLPFSVLALPAFILMVLAYFIAESPKYLVYKRYQIPSSSNTEFRDFVDSMEVRKGLKEMWHRKNRPVLVIKLMTCLLPQLLAAAPLLAFGPLVATSLSIEPAAVVAAFTAGLVGVAFTLSSGLYLLPRWGYRKLLLGALVMVFIAQISLWATLTFFADPYRDLRRWVARFTICTLTVYYSGTMILASPHGWISPVCTFSDAAAPIAYVVVESVSMLASATVMIMAPSLLCRFRAWIFLGLAGLVLLSGFLIYFLVPETTRVSKSEFVRRIWRPHWLWGRYMHDEQD